MNILITGVSRGMGRALALALLRNEGHTVIGLTRNREALIGLRGESQKKEYKSIFYGIQADVADPGSFASVAQQVKELSATVNAVVNNAGILIHKPFQELSPEDFNTMFATNVSGPFFLVRHLLPLMPPGSHVLNIGSMGGVQGSAKFPGLSLYSASKGALATLTEVLAEELKTNGIHVNCIAPGSVQTEMLAEAFPGFAASFGAEDAASFLCSFVLHGYRFFNGKILPMSVSTP